MKNGERYTTFVIIFMWIFILIIIYIIFAYRELFIQCDTEESPFCFTFTCPTETTESCGNYAYRCVDNGIICSSEPYTVKEVNISDSVNNICGK